MLARTVCFALQGVDGRPVTVETDVSGGLPNWAMVGLPDAAVRESRDRVSSALRNSGYAMPSGRVTVNLSPADLRKEGAAFDLPIAVSIVAASRQAALPNLEKVLLLGELGLDSRARGAVHGDCRAAGWRRIGDFACRERPGSPVFDRDADLSRPEPVRSNQPPERERAAVRPDSNFLFRLPHRQQTLARPVAGQRTARRAPGAGNRRGGRSQYAHDWGTGQRKNHAGPVSAGNSAKNDF